MGNLERTSAWRQSTRGLSSNAKRPLSRRQKLQKGAKSIWQHSRKVFAVSAVNGVSHIALAKSGGRRILWTGLFAFAIVGWFFQTTTLLEYYYKYPSVVKIFVEKPSVMDFPAVTICNVNRIRKSVFCKEFPERCEEENIVVSEAEFFNASFEFMVSGRKLMLGHQKDDIIVSCEFSGTPTLNTEQCLQYFVPVYHPHIGNCYTFLSGVDGRPKLFVSEPNAWQDKKDLDLVLNVEHDEYLDNSSTPGLIVTLHEDGTFPHLLSHDTHIYAQHSYALAVEKVTVNLLRAPFRTNCTDYKELPFHLPLDMDFSPRICTIQCLLYHQKKECPHSYVTDNVVLYEERMPYDPKEILEEDKQCAQQLSESYKEYCNSICEVPCQVNPAYVRIHYQSMEHRIYNHTPEFTTEILFSYLGGISGGWLGISLLEFCAFLESLFSVLVFAVARCCKTPCTKVKKKSARRPHSCRCGGQPVLLGVPMATKSGKTMQIVPYGYY
ncbi:hypothetical protein JTE90_017833 [Oedothorax gibbosus]|uniref:Uncharacterized protein n=1 Tax=Oedothorax gibbosus TaxID=931172 RepID=A0AAV6VAN9_9ARAC|nr:hypothetical protein JTE90_017833 [Oedothorax gibbosus]